MPLTPQPPPELPAEGPVDLLVVGGASLDLLHFRGRSVRSAGGAGLYTALAARRAGARVTMVGPRPVPMPAELARAARLIDWRGPAVPPERLPSFEIAHLGDGRSELVAHHWRSESELVPEMLPAGPTPDWSYCIPLTEPERQLAFVRHLAARGRPVACGTWEGAVLHHPGTVRRTLELVDAFFCNESEASGLFGSLAAARVAPGKLLFITRGPRGVRVLQGEYATDLPAVVVDELDPTGAGDTFCGTVLARLAQGEHPVQAARRGVAAAAEMVTAVGPQALLAAPPAPPPERDRRVRTEPSQVARVARLLAELPEVEPHSFVGEGLPRSGDPGALDFFFAATVQQFGFWRTRGGRYHEPLVATLGGRRRKGSDYLWAAYLRWLERRPGDLAAAGQRRLGRAALRAAMTDDDGACPLPELALRLRLARRYGADLEALGLTPAALVARANASRHPLATFLRQLDHVGGYKEDPWRKKSALLAIILRQRPEAFLRQEAAEPVPPVVDYHVQRSCLRLGLVRVEDAELERRLGARELLPPADEAAVREACYEAMAELAPASGRATGAVDWFFFQNRRRCPEMTTPDCANCPADPVCAHRLELFQPVWRTSFY